MRKIICFLKVNLNFAEKISSMKKYLFGFLFISLASFAQGPFGKINPSIPVDTLEASCGSCNFQMSKKGCYLAVKKSGVAYEVKGTGLDDHGDAHAKDGFCMAGTKSTRTRKDRKWLFCGTVF
jgi:hypothetical protein